MFDYYTIIAEIEASPDQVEMETQYALTEINTRMQEKDPDAVVTFDAEGLHFETNVDLIDGFIYEFEGLFEFKLKELIVSTQILRKGTIVSDIVDYTVEGFMAPYELDGCRYYVAINAEMCNIEDELGRIRRF